MARGITRDEVWKACDALLLEGARPTIERVRLKLGRGSPNTVSPMLETWFKHLGARITDPGAFAAPVSMPDPVHQAAQHLWEAAQAEARRDLDSRLQEGLAAAAADVEAEKERAAVAEAAAYSANVKATHLQLELDQLRHQMDQERSAHAATAARLDAMQLQRTDLQAELGQARAAAEEQRYRADQVIAAANERSAGAERRAALEIEHERSRRAEAEAAIASTSRRLEEALKEQALCSKELGMAQSTLAQLQLSTGNRERELLAGAELQRSRIEELEAELAEARLTNTRALSQGELVQQLVAAFSPAGGRARSANTKPRTPSNKRNKVAP